MWTLHNRAIDPNLRHCLAGKAAVVVIGVPDPLLYDVIDIGDPAASNNIDLTEIAAADAHLEAYKHRFYRVRMNRGYLLALFARELRKGFLPLYDLCFQSWCNQTETPGRGILWRALGSISKDCVFP